LVLPRIVMRDPFNFDANRGPEKSVKIYRVFYRKDIRIFLTSTYFYEIRTFFFLTVHLSQRFCLQFWSILLLGIFLRIRIREAKMLEPTDLDPKHFTKNLLERSSVLHESWSFKYY